MSSILYLYKCRKLYTSIFIAVDTYFYIVPELKYLFTEVDVMRLEAMDSLETLNLRGNPLPDDVKSQLSDSRLNVIKS